MTPAELIAGGYRMARKMVQLMCADLTEDEFRHQPVPGANSAAWIVGHLAVTVRRTAERVGATDLPMLTEEFVGKFSVTKQPAGAQSDLGRKEELLALLDVSVEKLMEALKTMPVEGFSGPAPNPGRFATNYGEALLFGAMHITMHCGQISTIRRSLGKPPQA
jgi:uncharacterized damage-inducible protein DinB